MYHNTSDVLPSDVALFVNAMLEVPDTTSYSSVKVHTYRLHHSTDYSHPLEMEVGLYDYGRRSFLQYNTYVPLLGKLYIIDVNTTHDPLTTHKIILTSDLRGTLSVMQHVLSSHDDSTTCAMIEESAIQTENKASRSITLRALNYNIWHNSPPSWFIPEQYVYIKRSTNNII